MIKEIGGKVASVWETLRPVTKRMIVGALQSDTGTPLTPAKLIYDAHADWELSSLLSALDERSSAKEVRSDVSKLNDVRLLAATCVRMLEAQSASAEVFIQLASRAVRNNDYNRLDKLADRLASRYAPPEIAEVARQAELPQIRAIAFETLAQLPVSALAPLLDDSLYAEIAASALEQKGYEFDSEEARDLLELYDLHQRSME